MEYLQEVRIQPVPLDRFDAIVGPTRAAQVGAGVLAAQRLLAGRTVWNVNSTAAGGGVAEMLQPLLAYARGAGVDARWLVIGGDAEFFRTTKRLHNNLHDLAGDGGDLGDKEAAHYAEVLDAPARELASLARPGDIVILHDPQTAGMVSAMRGAGAVVIWRCHIGHDEHTELVRRGWDYLRPFLADAHVYIFSRASYAPEWARERTRVVAPSIDPFSAKNEYLDTPHVQAILAKAGIISSEGVDLGVPPSFSRRDDEPGLVEREAIVVREGSPPPVTAHMVVQVSRWDRLKDMYGIMRGFADHVPVPDARLSLVGPDVSGVADDPEGPEVLEECKSAWQELPADVRARIQLVCLPMADLEENAAMVNAIQRHAAVVVQKSLYEGFGLTVAEAMWKARPIVASAVGGIQDQIVDKEHGLLLAEPTDLTAFGAAVAFFLTNPDFAERLGRAAHQRAIDLFLGSRHLLDYLALFQSMWEGEPAQAAAG